MTSLSFNFDGQETLLTAQHALAVVYGDRYPCSNAVRQGLEGILHQRYSGSQREFTDKFIRPTILLLERLKLKVILIYLFIFNTRKNNYYAAAV